MRRPMQTVAESFSCAFLRGRDVPFAGEGIEQAGQWEMAVDREKIADVIGRHDRLMRDRDGGDRQIGGGLCLAGGRICCEAGFVVKNVRSAGTAYMRPSTCAAGVSRGRISGAPASRMPASHRSTASATDGFARRVVSMPR